MSDSEHTNLPFVYKYYTVKETRTYEDLKGRYDTAKTGKEGVEAMIQQNQDSLTMVQNEVYTMVDKIKRSNERLAEIALRPNPLSSVDYLNLLIETEKMEAKPGWEGRVIQYNKIREREELFKSVDTISATPASESTTFWTGIQGTIQGVYFYIKAAVVVNK